MAALALGLPLGIVAGRWSWGVFARAAGVIPDPPVPVAVVLAAIPVTLILTSLIAIRPGWRAAQIKPAAILRIE
jgi:hypothetical protein